MKRTVKNYKYCFINQVDLLMEHKIMTSSTIHLDNLTIPQV